jgi:hypothetical protein
MEKSQPPGIALGSSNQNDNNPLGQDIEVTSSIDRKAAVLPAVEKVAPDHFLDRWCFRSRWASRNVGAGGRFHCQVRTDKCTHSSRLHRHAPVFTIQLDRERFARGGFCIRETEVKRYARKSARHAAFVSEDVHHAQRCKHKSTRLESAEHLGIHVIPQWVLWNSLSRVSRTADDPELGTDKRTGHTMKESGLKQ